MSFQPIVPTTGLVGWNYLQRTLDQQTELFAASTVFTNDTEYFLENIGNVKTAEDLVNDYRLFKVALGAFGLDDDIHNRYFMQKILEEGTLADDAMANRLADPRYKEMTEFFGFGSLTGPNVGKSSFGEDIVAMYKTRQFELAVGEQDGSMRMALNAARELEVLAAKDMSNEAKWFTIFGSPPLRQVFETALGLPSSISGIDLDQQLYIFQDKLERVTGSNDINQFLEQDAQDKLIERYFLMDQISNVDVMSSGQIALNLLQY